MNSINSRPGFWLACAITILALMPRDSDATIVEFQTVMGNFEVNLYDNATPQTVANFLAYVNGLQYADSIYHRSVPGFIIQGGGFAYNGALPIVDITSNAPVVNEPEFSNVRGTIAMAKLGGDPNSATNQWFFNLANNSANLDAQNGGFTVFGEVVGNGMDVIDAIAALPTYNFGGPLTDLPLTNYTAADFTNNVTPGGDNFVTIAAIVVTDATVDSAAGLNPPVNTLINPPPAPPPASGGGGGSLGIMLLMGMLLTYWRRKAIA